MKEIAGVGCTVDADGRAVAESIAVVVDVAAGVGVGEVEDPGFGACFEVAGEARLHRPSDRFLDLHTPNMNIPQAGNSQKIQQDS